MRHVISDAELRAMSAKDRERKLAEMIARTGGEPNGELIDVRARIHDLERAHQLSSAEMSRRVTEGTLRETWEICKWLLLVDRRERLEQRTAQAR